ncbi:lytic transglycosylase domain-containing protein [Pseudahrensia aquimaris]|uniref:Lytic transglycosylase domain-containing protein n=1 Tax=Pseudahrensia aquimaris TaxID=744461 RepID=A0ABW3FCB5_9HYPH
MLRNSIAVALGLLCLVSTAQASEDTKAKWTADRVCKTIENAAAAHDVPKDFFARLIWTESRFDVNALSPVGAQGIAQFMPGTAQERGLANPYDPEQALPASAALLRDHKNRFGNWVMAAAAYNAGPDRVRRWIEGNSFMPFETQNYIVSIFGLRIDRFKDSKAKATIPKLAKGRSFNEACRGLPIRRTRAKLGLLTAAYQPWGVQVAGNFSQSRAINSWLRVRAKLGLVLDASEPNIHRIRTPRGMRSRYAVRLGASNRTKANALCKKIRGAGGSCIVLKNKRR